VTAGYSSTPLGKKLGFVGPVYAHAVPERISAEIAEFAEIDWRGTMAGARDAHLFVTLRGEMAELLSQARKTLPDDAIVWLSWPKRAAKVPTDITEDVIREIALPMGWVDVKVCAVDAVWSGLKLMVRKELRAAKSKHTQNSQAKAA
jgi:hypothetical protein